MGVQDNISGIQNMMQAFNRKMLKTADTVVIVLGKGAGVGGCRHNWHSPIAIASTCGSCKSCW